MVCWHGAVLPNRRPSTVPLMEFGLRECDPDGPLHASTGRVHLRAEQALLMGHYRIGTMVFPDGSRQDRLAGQLGHRVFDVDFGRGGWEPCDAADLQTRHRDELRWLIGAPPNLPMIAFKLRSGGSLFVSCAEFFWRCYGRAKELQRIMLTYPWPEAELRLFGGQHAADADLFDVTLGPGVTDRDAVFLAYVRHDEHARRCAMSPFAAREASWPRGVQLRVEPWFAGMGQLKVRAIELARNAYLAVRIDGSSSPQGPKVRGVRLQSSLAGENAEAPSAEGEARSSLRRRLSGVVPISTDEDPDFAAGFGKAQDDAFEDLRPWREYEVIRSRRDGRGARVGKAGAKESPADYSTSEARSTGERIGQVRIESPTVEASAGVVLDMWHAMRSARQHHPDRIQSVDWYAPDLGFGDSSPPTLMAIPSGGGAADGGTPSGWRLFNPAAEPKELRPRGVLVMRMAIDGRMVCIVEIERRPRGVAREESYCGLVFPLGDSDDLRALLEPLLVNLPSVQGVFKVVLGICPPGAQIFRHSHAPTQSAPCEAAVRNALKKMDISLGGGATP